MNFSSIPFVVRATTIISGGEGSVSFVNSAREYQPFGTSQAVTISIAEGNTAVVFARVPNARTISSVEGSDTVSFGTLLHSEVFSTETHYYYKRDNCPALTSVTVTLDDGSSFDVVVYQWSVIGSSTTLDFSDGATYGAGTSDWEFASTPSVANTAFMANVQMDAADAWPVGVSPVVAAPASSDFSIRAYAELASSGAQTLTINMTTDGSTPVNRTGDRSWIVLRAVA